MTDVLAQRPEAEAKSIQRWLQRVRTGQIRIPRYQRPLRWRSRHIIDLFDSIRRGFPIGELLLSKQSAEADTISFGPVALSVEARSDALFVVDGQQRVVSLAGVLLHPDTTPRGDIHAIWYDLEKESFQRLKQAAPPVHWIPLRVAVDSFTLIQWLNEWNLRNERPDLVNRAIALGQAIREYEIPAYIVHDADERTLRLIFNRINNSGVRLMESEVFDALYGRGDHKPIEEACARLEEERMGKFDHDWFLRSVKAVGEVSPKQRASELQLEEHAELVFATEAALRRVLSFLLIEAGIGHLDLLPYKLPLVILAKFFHAHPHPAARTRLLLVRWLWRGALTGAHAGSSNAAVARLTGSIGDDEGSSVQGLLQSVSNEWEYPDVHGAWNTRSAKTKMLALALLGLHPIDPETDDAIDSEAIARLEKPIQGFVDIEGSDSHSGPFVRFVALPATDLPQRREKLSKLLSAPPEVLASHALSPAMVAALRAQDTERFIALRAEHFAAQAQRYFAERAGIGENDRPAIADILRKAAVA